MTPDEVIEKLKNGGVYISRSTLLRYEQAKVIPEPERGADGRGKGRFTNYPNETPAEFFASWSFIKEHHCNFTYLASIRVLGLELIKLESEYRVTQDAENSDLENEVFMRKLKLLGEYRRRHGSIFVQHACDWRDAIYFWDSSKDKLYTQLQKALNDNYKLINNLPPNIDDEVFKKIEGLAKKVELLSGENTKLKAELEKYKKLE